MLLVFARQIAKDDTSHVFGKERLEGTPSSIGVERQNLDNPLRQQVTHDECGIDADSRPPVIALQPGKAVGSESRHDVAKCRFGLGPVVSDTQASGPHEVGESPRQRGRRSGVSPKGAPEQFSLRFSKLGHGSPVGSGVPGDGQTRQDFVSPLHFCSEPGGKASPGRLTVWRSGTGPIP